MKTRECYWSFIIFTIWRATLVAGFKSFSETELTHMKQFREFMVKFNKTYESKAEEVKRFGIFKSNLKIIEKMNGDENEKAEFGVTMFSDLSEAEFEDQMLISFNETIEYQAMEEPVSKSLSSIIRRAPSSFSWTNHESYPPVESQGSCRICCVFSMVGALSIMYSVHRGQPINLSKQRESLQYTGNVITNCPNQRGNHGVVIVGYGEEEGVPYYLVRNSWGSNYGILNGHAKIKRGTCATHEAVYKLTMKIKGEGCCG
nr:PREDICTED: cruzipain-like [Bemisia tabaci]